MSKKNIPQTYLFVGPPGSGRSDIANAYAKRLVGDVNLEDSPDIRVVKTNRLSIGVNEIRDLISLAANTPMSLKYRVFIIHDADRLTEAAQNALLKSIEEPIETTIWLLIAPSSEDLLPTVRSRSQLVHLKTPKVESIVQLLILEGFDELKARTCTKLANCHIGIARHLLSDSNALNERIKIADMALTTTSVSRAVLNAETILSDATKDYKEVTEERYTKAEDELKRTLGIDDKKAIPPAFKQQFKQLSDEKELALKRGLRDYVDIKLQEMLMIYRDISLLQSGASQDLVVNAMVLDKLQVYAKSQTIADTVLKVKSIERARQKLHGNCLVNLTLAALFSDLLIPERVLVH
ncbi:DNA polymerase III subunit delta' [Actinomycetota bacterium]|nr:DNA polymerase III subunit delta' [Actinomycetota bacterium]